MIIFIDRYIIKNYNYPNAVQLHPINGKKPIHLMSAGMACLYMFILYAFVLFRYGNPLVEHSQFPPQFPPLPQAESREALTSSSPSSSLPSSVTCCENQIHRTMHAMYI